MNILKHIVSLFLAVFLFNASVLAEGLSVTLDFTRYKYEKGKALVEFIISVDASTIQKSPSQGIPAGVGIFFGVKDSSGYTAAEKLSITRPVDSASLVPGTALLIKKKVLLPYGRYELEVAAIDWNDPKKDTLRVSVPFSTSFNDLGVSISDLCFLESYKKAEQPSDFVKHGMELKPYLSAFYPGNVHSIKCFGEIYGLAEKVAPADKAVIVYSIFMKGQRYAVENLGKTAIIKVEPNQAFIDEIDISKLPSGNYYLALEVKDKDGKHLASKTKFFQRSNPVLDKQLADAGYADPADVAGTFVANVPESELRLLTSSLQPIANTAESNTVVWLAKNGNITQLQQYQLNFWRKRNKENPEKAFEDYRKLVSNAEKLYATKTFRAYETDRGRVYLQYGPPNLIEDELSDRFRKAMDNRNVIPYQVWYYYSLEQQNQSNIIFVFVQENRGYSNYRLLHSTAIGEVYNREWRRVIENNFTNNFDALDPNDKYDLQDAMRFR